MSKLNYSLAHTTVINKTPNWLKSFSVNFKKAIPVMSEMDKQYQLLSEKVKLIAANKSHSIKSLLITGAPSSGKSFNVQKAITECGLVEGRDYIIKKGKITDIAMYRTLLENLDGLIIFDDCDSVVDSKHGKNILKGALDMDAVRNISYDTNRSKNTASMSETDRRLYCQMASRILRDVATTKDLENWNGDKTAAFKEVKNSLPNMIPFTGRIIFISNMTEDQWDPAILSRSFRENLEFSSDDMLDHIYKMHDKLETGISASKCREVLDYVKQLHESGELVNDINFRLILQCFDLRQTSNWKEQIRQL